MSWFDQITVREIYKVYTVPLYKGRKFVMNGRPRYGLSFCLGGKCTYYCNGKQYVSDATHAILIPKGAHYTSICDEGGDFPLIDFDCIEAPVTDFSVIKLSSPEGFFKDFERLQHTSGHAAALSRLYEILARLSLLERHPKSQISEALKYLEANYTDSSLDNARLAEAAGISEVYFRRLFSAEIGCSPKQYVLRLRLTLACRLLTESHRSITEIAERSGFTDIYHFCRAFKSFTAQTPTDYRRQNTPTGL